MSKKNEANVEVIENASPDDIRPGDYVIWEWGRERGGVLIMERREGIAHHRDEGGYWLTKDSVWIAGAAWPWRGAAITIRRPITEVG